LLAGDRLLLTGRNYFWFDLLSDIQLSALRSQPSAIRYWLEDVDLNGKRTRYGPAEIQTSVISNQLSAKKILKPELLSELGVKVQERYRDFWKAQEVRERLKQRPIGRPVPSSHRTLESHEHSFNPFLPQSVVSSYEERLIQWYLAGMPGVKILVREEGWYRVGKADLIATGLPPTANSRYLQLYAEGREQPLRVIEGQGRRSDQWDGIEFYGLGLDTPSTDTRVYWLVEGWTSGKRIQKSGGWGGWTSSSSFPYTAERKDRLLYFAALRNGEESNFFGLVVSATPLDQIINVSHPDFGSSWEGVLEVSFQGVTNVKHQVRVFFNGMDAGEILFEGQNRGFVKLSIPQSHLLEGENLVTLLTQGDPVDISLVDTIRFNYWRTYQVNENSLKFTAQAGRELTLSGFGQPGIRVIDITNPELAVEVRGTVNAEGSGYSFTFKTPGLGGRKLLAFTEDRIKAGAAIVANELSSWHLSWNGYDLVIVSHKDFLQSLEPLKSLRESQGLSVASVDVEDLYDEFSFGAKSPQAIKDFLSLAKKQWKKKPRFLLLVGDATFDPRNYLGLGDYDFVPVKLVDTNYLETASDDWFVDFNEDGLPEMAVGRLPVRTIEEANTVISKIIAYEQGSGNVKKEVLLVADIKDEEFDYESASDEVKALLPTNVRASEIYRGRFGDDAQVRNELLRSINEGKLVVNFVGHGSVEIWRGSIFSSDDAEALTNGMNLPFFVSMTCLNGYFHDVYTDSLGESLLKARQGGAVAVWASSGLTEPDKQIPMNKELIKLLFDGKKKSLTLGEATMKAKEAATDAVVRRTWILFGDPAMRLRP